MNNGNKNSLPFIDFRQNSCILYFIKVSPEDITIVDQKCGYLEAPINYTQEYLRPGCSVSFKIEESTAETYPQIFIPLEDAGDTI